MPTMIDSTEQKPASLDVEQEFIPGELKQMQRWICWLYEFREGNSKPWTKPPISLKNSRRQARVNDPSECATFEQAILLHENEFSATDGIGLILFEGDGLVAVDLDDCRDPDSETIEEWAAEIAEKLNSYTEISPSGTGLRIFCYGTLPDNGRKKGKFEIYSSGRYVTVTGHHLDGTSRAVERRAEEINEVHAGFFTEAVMEPILLSEQGDSSDEVDIEALHDSALTDSKFNKLWNGDWSDGYASQSEADLALCSKLAFYLGNNSEQINAAFRKSSLYREKWDQTAYATDTIQKAIVQSEDRFDHDLSSEQLDQVNALIQPLPASEQMPELPQLIEDEPDDTANLNIFRLSQLRQLPPPRWQIEGHIPEKSFTLIYGPPASGKSFYALDLSLCVATGKQFLGVHDVVQGSAVYIASEGCQGIRNRTESWLSCHGQELESVVENNFRVIPDSFDLKNPQSAVEIGKLITSAISGHPSLLVIDTLSRNLNGDENTPRDMTGFISTCGLLQKHLHCTVVVIHHTGHDTSRERGHSSLRAAADSIIAVKGKVFGGKGVTIECKKQKDAAEFSPYELNGRQENESLVLLPDANPWETKFHKLSETARSVLNHVSMKYSTDKEFRNKDLASELELSSSTVSDALKKLVNDGFLKKNKQIYRLNLEASGVLLIGL